MSCTSVKDLDTSLDLFVTADNAVDLALCGTLSEVCTEFIEVLETLFASNLSGILACLSVL